MGRKKRERITESFKRSQKRKTHLGDKDGLRLKVLKPEILLIGVFILALSIRLLYINQIISTPIFQGLAVDTEKYNDFSLQILKGNLTHKDFIYLNPLYPFFLTIIYLIFGYSHLSVIIIQGIIDSLSCILIYYITSTIFNKRTGILAAIIYACYGLAIFYTGILLAPTVVIFLTLLFISSLLAAENKKQVIIFFISGIIFGLAVLARPNLSVFLFILPLWFFIVLKNKLGTYKSIQGFTLLLVGFLVVIFLITIRNYSIEKRFSPFSVQGGINFYIGNNPKATGHFMSPHGISNSPIEQVNASIKYAEQESGKRLSPSQASRYWLIKGLNFIKDNPLDAFLLYVKKFAIFWRNEEIPLNINYSLSKTFATIFKLPFISFGIIAPFAILGIILSLKRKKDIMLVNLFIFSYMLSVIIFFVSARYRLPIVPFLVICSSYTLYRFLEMIRAKEINNIAFFGILLILLVVGINKNIKYFTFDTSSRHYNNLGRVYDMEGRLDQAVVELKKALLINSNSAVAHNNLGNVYLKKGLLKKAIDEYKKSLKINADYADAHTNLGNAYYSKGMLDEAISEHKKALSKNPYHKEAHVNLGRVYSRKGRLDEAISEYKKALSANLDRAEVYYNLANVYLKKGRLDEAIAGFEQALAINPRYAKAHNNLGNAYYKKGELDKAIAEYKQALAINPRYAMAHNNLGNAYSKKGHHKLAKIHYDKVKEIGYKNPPNY